MKTRSVAAICGILALVGPQAVYAQCLANFTLPQDVKAADRLLSVASTSQSDVWAVGSSDRQDPDFTNGLVEHFNGTGWSIVPAQDPTGARSVTFAAVTALASDDAWLAGYTEHQPLIEHWNGGSWSISSISPKRDERLFGTSGRPADPDLVFAVGCICGGGIAGGEPVAEKWNGASWTRSFPPVKSSSGALVAVATTPTGTAWAVGNDQYKTLIDHWNGAKWLQVTGAFTGVGNLTSVSAVSDEDVWVVGRSGTPPNSTFIEHWNGTSWTIVPFAHQPGAQLTEISAASATDVWAAGTFSPIPTFSVDLVLLERWDGMTWTIVPAPSGNIVNNVAGIVDELGLATMVGSSDSFTVPQQVLAIQSHC